MRKFLLILSTLFCCVALNAQIDRTKAPLAGPAPKVQMGDVQSFTLKNGLKVLVVENHNYPKVNISLNVKLDPIEEGKKAGYLSMTGELWGKATTNRDTKVLNAEIDFIGSNLGTSSSGVNISGLSKYTDKMMELFADVVLNPAFPQDEFDKLVLQNQSALKANSVDPESILDNIKKTTMFPAGHPLSDVMTEASLANITVDDCRNYYKTFIHPNNSVIVVVGDIDMKNVEKLVNKYFAKWQKGEAPAFNYAVPVEPKGLNVVFSNKDAANQAELSIAYPLDYHIGQPDQFAAQMAIQILGSGGFESKLMQNLRESKGYTYGASSRMYSNTLKGSGQFFASSKVKAEVVDSAAMEILKEMKNMINGDFTTETLENIKKTNAGDFSRSLESPNTVATFAYYIERYNLPKDFYETYLQKLAKVTKEDVIAASKKYLHPDNAYIFAVTDRSQKEKLQKLATNGKVVELDNYGQPVKESPKVASNVTAESVIDNYLKAIGGKDKVLAIKDMSVTMEMSVQGMTIKTVSQYILSGKKPAYKMEMSMAGNIMTKMLFDGEKATVSSMGQEQVLEGEQAAALASQAYPILEAYYPQVNITPSLEGIEKVNGKDAYKIKVTLNNAVTYSFYDVETGLKVKQVGTENGQSTEVYLEDYRMTDYGISYNFINKTTMQGMPIEMKVTEIKINSGLKF